MHLSPASDGWHQHYFSLPGLDLAVGARELLFAYLYLPLSNAPTAVALRWLATGTNGPSAGSWEHCAPLTAWLSANPTKRPDVPVRINGWTNEGYLQYWVSNADNSVSYDIYTNSVGIPPFITHINMRDPVHHQRRTVYELHQQASDLRRELFARKASHQRCSGRIRWNDLRPGQRPPRDNGYQ